MFIGLLIVDGMVRSAFAADSSNPLIKDTASVSATSPDVRKLFGPTLTCPVFRPKYFSAPEVHRYSDGCFDVDKGHEGIAGVTGCQSSLINCG